MKIVFMGTPDFSVPILKNLNKHYNVVLVVTQPDTPKGRKRTLTPPPVKVCAKTLEIPVFQPTNIKKNYKAILDLNPDMIITAAYGQIVPDVLLETPPYKALNIHASLLPKLRGGAPIQRAIERSHKKTGITVMQMAKKMDAGPIYDQLEVTIDQDETSSSLFAKLSNKASDYIIEILPKIINQDLKPVAQNHEDATYATNIKREEERLDFTQSANELEAKIRAFYASPNTYTVIGDEKLKVIKARVHRCKNFIKNHQDDPNGKVIKFFPDGIAVKCKEDVLVLTEVQLAGKKPQPADQFMQGAGKARIKLGTLLG